MPRRYGNVASTTLAAAITSAGQTSITVSGVTGFPAIDPAKAEVFDAVLVDDITPLPNVVEYVTVTARSDPTWTIRRATHDASRFPATTHPIARRLVLVKVALAEAWPSYEDYPVIEYATTSSPVGVGNAANDRAAILACLADINSSTSKEKRVRFTGGKNWHIDQNVVWPDGVHMKGGPGSSANVNRPVEIRWDGPAGGTMFSSPDAESNQLFEEIFFREGTSIPGKHVELASPVDQVDQGTQFNRCWHGASSIAAIDILGGPTNIKISNFRMDSFSGAAIRVKVNAAARHLIIDGFTVDPGSAAGPFLVLDGGPAGAGQNCWISAEISNGKIEVNSPPTGEKALIVCVADHLNTGGPQFYIRIDGVPIAAGSGVADWAYVGFRNTDASLGRKIRVDVTGCPVGGVSTSRTIDGVVDPPDRTGWTGSVPGSWGYGPQGPGFAAPASSAQLDDYQTQMRIRDLLIGNGPPLNVLGTGLGRGAVRLHNALQVPTANPTGGGVLYVEGGALKYRGSSGTVTTLGPA